MGAITQENRQIAVETPLGDDVLALMSFTGQEEMSRLFQYRLEMLSEEDSIAAKEIVGKSVTFSTRLPDGTPRYFHGFVSRFLAGSRETGYRRYYAEVVPWLWFLTRTADCRIFQNKSVPEIVQQVFSDLGFSDYALDLQGAHKKREYCVQYRETDFDFVSRLMEEEGVFYYFRHEKDKHALVLADHKGAYKDLPENEVEYEYSYGALSGPDRLTRWEHQYEFISGKWAQTDYNFKDQPARSEPTPGSLLMSNEKSLIELARLDKFEVYDYPGRYADKADGEALTRLRMEEEEATHDVVLAGSTCKSFAPGGKFKVTRHDCKAEEGKGFVVTSIRHAAAEPLQSAGAASAAEDYSNTFTCIPDSVTFRPRRTTPRPVVRGVQPAVVVGPGGEEIYVDEYGRVKVQFFWDREGKRDENSSCWVRVSQAYAGKNWGAVTIPRIGQEVIVDFLEGDPDQPIILGRVYNADQTPPYPLPAQKMVSGLKSESTPGGGGYNEYVMDDTKGNELIREHGQFDKDSTIEHDLREHVLHDRSRDVANDESIVIGHNRDKLVKNDESSAIQGNRSETVGKDETISIDGNRTESVRKNESISIDGKRSETVGKDESITIGGKRTEIVDKDESVTISGNRQKTVNKSEEQSIAENLALKVGKEQSIDVGKKLMIKAGDEVSIQTGQASIVLKKDGTVQISGKDITVKGSGKINAKAAKDFILKGQKILHN